MLRFNQMARSTTFKNSKKFPLPVFFLKKILLEISSGIDGAINGNGVDPEIRVFLRPDFVGIPSDGSE